MSGPRTTPSSRDEVRAHRARLRAQGLRPIQLWVPDMRAPQFREAARAQALAVARSAHADEDQAFVDALAEWTRDE